MESLPRAKASQRAYVSHLRRTLSVVNDLDLSSADQMVIDANREKLLSSRKKLDHIGNQILELLDDEKAVENEIAEQEHLSDLIIDALAKIDSIKVCDTPASEASSACSSNSGLEGLPKINLPTFSGDYLSWRPFYDQFNATVHCRNISDVQKFTYLLSAIRGDARDAIRGIPCTSENYSSAFKVLRDRFGDPSLLISLYADRLVNLPAVRTNDTVSFRNLVTNFESHLREIKQLINEVLNSSATDSASASVHDLLLAPLLTGKLPHASQLEWARRAKSPKEKFDLSGLLTFAKSEVEALETLSTIRSANNTSVSRKTAPHRNERPAAAVNSLKVTTIPPCRLCDSDSPHSSFKCQSFMRMDPQQRHELVRNRSLCFNCLSNHRLKDCRSSARCHHCDRQHHTLLHRDPVRDSAPEPTRSAQPASGDSSPTVSISANCVSSDSHKQRVSILETARVRVHGVPRIVRILIDSGSEESYVTQALARESAAQRIDRRSLQFDVFLGSRSDSLEYDVCRLYLRALHRDGWVSAKLISVPTICSPTRTLPSDQLEKIHKRFPQMNLADSVADDSSIDILLGMDAIPQILLTEERSFTFERLMLTPSIFGYVIGGSIASTCPNRSLVSIVKGLRVASSIDNIAKLWELEGIGIESALPTTKPASPQFNGDRYEISLPWIDCSRPSLTLTQAHSRNSHFKRLSAEKKLSYCETLQNYLDAGILEPASEDNGNFIPHHAVYQKGKQRIVYDASAKPWKGPSLNDCLQPGPNLLSDLTAILLRFRSRCFPLVADVEKAFLMVSVTPVDRQYLKIVWLDKDNHKRVSQFTRVPFGLTCGPYLLLEVLRTHLSSTSDPSDLQKHLRDDLYMDDIVSGHDTISDVTQLKDFAEVKFAEAGMNLRDFLSTPMVMQAWTCEPSPISRKVLGVHWSPDIDSLSVSLCIPPATTRRQVASAVAQIFDPLGLASPWTIRLRIFLQRLWKSCDDWDGPLSSTDQEEYNSLQMESVDQVISLPRYVACNCESELHIYADASQKAFAAAVYVKCNDKVSLLCSRARVTPLKPVLTLPRLELMAALLAVRLLRFVQENLPQMPLRVRLYSDSMIVIGWIRKPPTDIFVRNRLKEILSITSPADWSHVSGETNPADLPSRGVSATDLPTSRTWFHGPQDLSVCPQRTTTTATVTTTSATPDSDKTVFPLSRYSSLRKAVRIAAWVKRFIVNLINKEKTNGELSAQEEDHGMVMLIQDCQKSNGWREFQALTGGADVPANSVIFDGRPEMNHEKGIIFCNPRNGEPPVPWLPVPSLLARLIVLDVHQKLYHMGVSATNTEMKLSYWTRRCRQFVKKTISSCTKCRRIQSRKALCPEGDLPAFRTTPSRPFEKTGLDHFGPLTLRNKSKTWVLLFTCAVTRAVHLEAVPSLDVQETALAIRRFFARRGQSNLFLSDNGRSFVALSRILKGTNLRWNLLPPAAPWWGGFWERLVGTIKRACLKTLGNVSLSHTELTTVLTELENSINRRPLTAAADDDLTPAHFLFGSTPAPVSRSCLPLVSDISDSSSERLLRLHNHRQMISAHLWTRWQKEYLTSLRTWRRPNTARGRNLQLNDIVLIAPPDGVKVPRLKWPLGRITRLIPGRDGRIRVCEVKTKNSVTQRPLNRLYLLESD